MTMEGTGIVPVMDLNQNRGYGYGDGMGYGGGWFMWIFAIFALMGGWGGNWGGRGGYGYDAAATFANGAFTRNEISDGFANQETHNGIRGIQNGLCDGFYATNTNLLQGFNGTQRDILDSRYQLGSAIAENRFAAQNCCCELSKELMVNRYEAAQHTCAITTNDTANTQKILDKLCQMEANAKDAQIADLREKLAVSNLQVSQQVQNATLINALRPFPQPAYITSSPYAAMPINAGYNRGCNECNYQQFNGSFLWTVRPVQERRLTTIIFNL